MPKRFGSSARGARAAVSVRRTRRQVDFSDIPDSSAEQLEAMRRVGRPPLGNEPRQLIAIRLDAGVLDQLRKEARRRRVGYQTLINEVLARHVRKEWSVTFVSGHHCRTAGSSLDGLTRSEDPVLPRSHPPLVHPTRSKGPTTAMRSPWPQSTFRRHLSRMRR